MTRKPATDKDKERVVRRKMTIRPMTDAEWIVARRSVLRQNALKIRVLKASDVLTRRLASRKAAWMGIHAGRDGLRYVIPPYELRPLMNACARLAARNLGRKKK